MSNPIKEIVDSIQFEHDHPYLAALAQFVRAVAQYFIIAVIFWAAYRVIV